VNFEAGALSKIFDKSFVTPFLFDLKRSDVHGPLLQFQSTIWEKDDVLKLVKSINNRVSDGEKLKEEMLTKAFEVWWPQLDLQMKDIRPVEEDATKNKAQQKDKSAVILEELLDLTRAHQKLLNNPPALLPPDYLMSMIYEANERSHERTRRHHESFVRIYDIVSELRVLVDDPEVVSETHIHMQNGLAQVHELLRKMYPDAQYDSERNLRLLRRPKQKGS
jgi:hypothetical protein